MPSGETIPARFFASVEQHAEREALRWRRLFWRSMSYRTLGGRVRSVARGLAALGIEPGDRICILSHNRAGWIIGDLAALAAGAVTVPIYSTSSAETIRYILRHSEARLVLAAEGPCMDAVAAANVPGVRAIPIGGLPDLSRRGEAVSAEEIEKRMSEMRPGDLATIIYTSGTTGEPKGVMLSHGNILSNIDQMLAGFHVGPEDRTLSFLPLSHALERIAGMFLMLFQGATVAIAQEIATLPGDLLDQQPTILISVPRVLEKFHVRVWEKVNDRSRFVRLIFARAVSRAKGETQKGTADGSMRYRVYDRLFFRKIRARLGGRLRMVISGGAALSAEIAEFFGALGVPVLEGYGLTEASPVVSVNRLGRNKPGTVGLPLPGVSVTAAQDGEILVRGANVMMGYHRDPRATEEAIDADGWLHTGDIGEFDADGFLRITDRKKELIVTSGGKKVAPQVLENELKLQALVNQAAVVGDGRNYISALVVPDFDALAKKLEALGIRSEGREEMLARPEVRRWFQAAVDAVNARRASFEQIKKFELLPAEWTVEAEEITPTLKLRRKVLCERYARVIERMYANSEPCRT